MQHSITKRWLIKTAMKKLSLTQFYELSTVPKYLCLVLNEGSEKKKKKTKTSQVSKQDSVPC